MEETKETTAEEVLTAYSGDTGVQDEGELETVEGEMPETEEIKAEEV